MPKQLLSHLNMITSCLKFCVICFILKTKGLLGGLTKIQVEKKRNLQSCNNCLPKTYCLLFYIAEAFQYLSGANKKERGLLFPRVDNDRTREDDFKLKKVDLDYVSGRNSLVVRPWHILPREAVDDQLLAVFKARLHGALSTLVYGDVFLLMELDAL